VVLRVAHGLAAQEECARMHASLIVMSRDLFSMKARGERSGVGGRRVGRREHELDGALLSAAS